MLRSSFPRPARVPVHVTGMLVVPENVHTGVPPFLKCGLAANAAGAARAAVTRTNAAASNRRRIRPPCLEGQNAHPAMGGAHRRVKLYDAMRIASPPSSYGKTCPSCGGQSGSRRPSAPLRCRQRSSRRSLSGLCRGERQPQSSANRKPSPCGALPDRHTGIRAPLDANVKLVHCVRLGVIDRAESRTIYRVRCPDAQFCSGAGLVRLSRLGLAPTSSTTTRPRQFVTGRSPPGCASDAEREGARRPTAEEATWLAPSLRSPQEGSTLLLDDQRFNCSSAQAAERRSSAGAYWARGGRFPDPRAVSSM
jgi:hypothetical protein